MVEIRHPLTRVLSNVERQTNKRRNTMRISETMAQFYFVPPPENTIKMYFEPPGNTQICNVNILSSNDEYSDNI
jgi:hypothetical protein